MIAVRCSDCNETIMAETFVRCLCGAIAVDDNRIIGNLDKAIVLDKRMR